MCLCVCACMYVYTGDETCLEGQAEMARGSSGRKGRMFLKELNEPSGSWPSNWCSLT